MSTILMIYYSIFSNEDSFENAVRKFGIFLYSDDVQNIDKIFENSLQFPRDLARKYIIKIDILLYAFKNNS